MGNSAHRSIEERFPPFLRVTARRWLKVYRSGSRLSWLVTDLVIRIAIAQTIFRSGLVKAMDWETALLLATYEYPVSWMAPETAAAIGLVIEVLGPVLLALGLFTRPAALAMGTLIAVSQAVYVPTTTNLFLISLLGWYALGGAGPIAFDRIFAPGLRSSAIPLGKQAVMVGEWLGKYMAPLWMLGIRFWLALTLLAAAEIFEPSIFLATWLPITSLAGVPDLVAIALAVPLVIGFATSVVALLLLLTGGAIAIAGLHPDISLYPILLLALFEARGPGLFSVDGAIENWFERNFLHDRNYHDIPQEWPHIVIIGAGFGGLAAANRLKRLPVRITLMDRRNYHLFQPLLYQVASATLNPADIAVPIRSLFREDGNVRVVKGRVDAIDHEGRKVFYDGNRELEFDKLILATGASHSYFGKDEWGAFAPGLKRVEDAVAVRASILNAFEWNWPGQSLS